MQNHLRRMLPHERRDHLSTHRTPFVEHGRPCDLHRHRHPSSSTALSFLNAASTTPIASPRRETSNAPCISRRLPRTTELPSVEGEVTDFFRHDPQLFFVGGWSDPRRRRLEMKFFFRHRSSTQKPQTDFSRKKVGAMSQKVRHLVAFGRL